MDAKEFNKYRIVQREDGYWLQFDSMYHHRYSDAYKPLWFDLSGHAFLESSVPNPFETIDDAEKWLDDFLFKKEDNENVVSELTEKHGWIRS